MPIDLRKLLSNFEDVENRESRTAYFQTHVPWVAPLAYLNIIFKPLPDQARENSLRKFVVPPPLAEFYRLQNGAILFSGALSIYGFRVAGQLLNREDPFARLPHNIEDHWQKLEAELLPFAGYSFDGSRVFIGRSDCKVYVSRGTEPAPSCMWKCLEEWIHGEISRLSSLFDRRGKQLADLSFTVPCSGRIGC